MFGLGPLALTVMLVYLVVGVPFYMLPTIIAYFRRHPNTLGIFIPTMIPRP